MNTELHHARRDRVQVVHKYTLPQISIAAIIVVDIIVVDIIVVDMIVVDSRVGMICKYNRPPSLG